MRIRKDSVKISKQIALRFLTDQLSVVISFGKGDERRNHEPNSSPALISLVDQHSLSPLQGIEMHPHCFTTDHCAISTATNFTRCTRP